MLETERLTLTPPVLADMDERLGMYGDALHARYVGGVPTREEAWNKLLRNIGHWHAFGYGLFTVRDRGGRFVGEMGLAHFARGLGAAFDPFPEAAWVLCPDAQGRGYAREALLAAHDWFATDHGAGRTVCIIHPENHPSLRVAEAIGYRRFGEADYRGAPAVMLEREG